MSSQIRGTAPAQLLIEPIQRHALLPALCSMRRYLTAWSALSLCSCSLTVIQGASFVQIWSAGIFNLL